MLVIQNKGNIDTSVLNTFGVNVKNTDEAIGEFGTGLKYALAVFARENIPVEIHTNGTIYELSTTDEIVRGKTFKFITLSHLGVTNYTTELGKNWGIEDAFRELISNANDEGEYKLTRTDHFTPRTGYTYFVISHLDSQYNNIKNLFLNTNTLFMTTDVVDIHKYNPNSPVFYYRRYSVQQALKYRLADKIPLFAYNVHNKCDLTEDRTIKYAFEYMHNIELFFLKYASEDMLKLVFNSPDSFEYSLEFDSMAYGNNVSKTFVQTVKDNRLIAPNSALKAVRRIGGLSELAPQPKEIPDKDLKNYKNIFRALKKKFKILNSVKSVAHIKISDVTTPSIVDGNLYMPVPENEDDFILMCIMAHGNIIDRYSVANICIELIKTKL